MPVRWEIRWRQWDYFSIMKNFFCSRLALNGDCFISCLDYFKMSLANMWEFISSTLTWECNLYPYHQITVNGSRMCFMPNSFVIVSIVACMSLVKCGRCCLDYCCEPIRPRRDDFSGVTEGWGLASRWGGVLRVPNLPFYRFDSGVCVGCRL